MTIAREIAEQAKNASRKLAVTSAEQRNEALMAIGVALKEAAPEIRDANEMDISRGKESGLSTALIDRLTLTESRLQGVSDCFQSVARLPDPIGHLLEETRRPSGILIHKMSVPIGVLLVIFESRPNVTAEVASLTLKSGNAVILRGGKEALHSNDAIAETIRSALARTKLPTDAVQFVATPDRQVFQELLLLDDWIDLVMPRGGEQLIRFVAETSKIPVIKHYKGVCHLYVDKDADFEMAERLCMNAKCQRPAVCNAIETLLVHRAVAAEALPRLCDALVKKGVELRGDEEVCRLVPVAKPATEEDWSTEYLDLTLSVKVSPDLDAAIAHINMYGSHHSDAIVSSDKNAVDRFLAEVDSACVYANASTRFTDGGEFGMGAEIGISTDKLHARGPMGLRELTTYKYLVRGNGEVRQS